MLQFTQNEIEREVAAILRHGDIARISQVSGIGYSYVDQMLNPNDERKSYLVGALEILCALDEIDPVRGNKLFQKLASFRELSKSERSDDGSCINASTSKLHKEVADVVGAHLEGKCYYDQLNEALEARDAIEKQISIILQKINEEKETEGGARLRLAK